MTNPRQEEPWERTDRNLNDLLQELRVALPGVQVLFAFLLAVPFQSRFGLVTEFQQSLYFATLIFTACSSLLLIAPTAFHRLTFRRQQKERLLYFANRFTVLGLAFLGLAVTGAVTLITDFLYGSAPALAAAIVSLTAFGVIWIYFPLKARSESDAP